MGLPDEDWHKKIDSVVYHGMDWICPGNSQAMYNQITKHWGNLSAEVAIRDITAVETSGDTHLAYYDLKKMKMWVSFARQSYLTGPTRRLTGSLSASIWQASSLSPTPKL